MEDAFNVPCFVLFAHQSQCVPLVLMDIMMMKMENVRYVWMDVLLAILLIPAKLTKMELS